MACSTLKRTPTRPALTFTIEKLNPHTGVTERMAGVAKPPIGGVFPQSPILTPDGASYYYSFRLNISDLYTISGVR